VLCNTSRFKHCFNPGGTIAGAEDVDLKCNVQMKHKSEFSDRVVLLRLLRQAMTVIIVDQAIYMILTYAFHITVSRPVVTGMYKLATTVNLNKE
jgi:hypothetical protein